MGGFGSGRSCIKKILVEDCFQINIDKLYRLGGIGVKHDYILKWQHPRNREVFSEIRVKADNNSLILSYEAVIKATQERLGIQTLIEIEWTNPPLGGRRPWFICPECNKRIGKLYKPNNEHFFWCRLCWDLTYQSRMDGNDSISVALNKINRLKKKLRWNCGDEEVATEYSPLPPRPKGQHKKTYQKIIEQIIKTEEVAKNAMIDIYKKLTGEGVDGY